MGVLPGRRLTLTQEKALAQGAEQRRREDIVAALRLCFPEQTEELSRQDIMDTVGRVVLRMGAYDIRKLGNIHVLASWQFFYGDLFERQDPNDDL